MAFECVAPTTHDATNNSAAVCDYVCSAIATLSGISSTYRLLHVGVKKVAAV